MNRTRVFYVAVVLLVELLLAPVGSLSSATVATVVGTKTDGGFVTLKTFPAAVTATGALGGRRRSLHSLRKEEDLFLTCPGIDIF
jgi:hypothetical protein